MKIDVRDLNGFRRVKQDRIGRAASCSVERVERFTKCWFCESEHFGQKAAIFCVTTPAKGKGGVYAIASCAEHAALALDRMLDRDAAYETEIGIKIGDHSCIASKKPCEDFRPRFFSARTLDAKNDHCFRCDLYAVAAGHPSARGHWHPRRELAAARRSMGLRPIWPKRVAS